MDRSYVNGDLFMNYLRLEFERARLRLNELDLK